VRLSSKIGAVTTFQAVPLYRQLTTSRSDSLDCGGIGLRAGTMISGHRTLTQGPQCAVWPMGRRFSWQIHLIVNLPQRVERHRFRQPKAPITSVQSLAAMTVRMTVRMRLRARFCEFCVGGRRVRASKVGGNLTHGGGASRETTVLKYSRHGVSRALG